MSFCSLLHEWQLDNMYNFGIMLFAFSRHGAASSKAPRLLWLKSRMKRKEAIKERKEGASKFRALEGVLQNWNLFYWVRCLSKGVIGPRCFFGGSTEGKNKHGCGRSVGASAIVWARGGSDGLGTEVQCVRWSWQDLSVEWNMGDQDGGDEE